jgi:hypothetical protein
MPIRIGKSTIGTIGIREHSVNGTHARPFRGDLLENLDGGPLITSVESNARLSDLR